MKFTVPTTAQVAAAAMTSPTVTAVSDETLTDHELRELHAELGAIPFYSTLSMPHRARIAVAELLRARSALADVGECEACKGQRTVQGPAVPGLFNLLGPHYQSLPCPSCTGKQPRPAEEVCPYCGALEHAPRCCQESPAAHTAQEDASDKLLREIDEYLSGHPQNSVFCGSKLHQDIKRRLASTAERE